MGDESVTACSGERAQEGYIDPLADGNIRHANDQNEEQMVEFLGLNGHSDWMDWVA